MKPSDKKVDVGRRSFLSLAGAGAIAGGATLASGGATAATPDVAADQDNKVYRETDHVRRVYEYSRF
ncbi:MAG: formate dehydrogenase [Pseudomonadota bacterium]